MPLEDRYILNLSLDFFGVKPGFVDMDSAGRFGLEEPSFGEN
jgi:hypothetical protein